VNEAKGQIEKKNAELDSLYQDNSSVYEQMETIQQKMKGFEAS